MSGKCSGLLDLSLSRNKIEQVNLRQITECFPALEVLNLSQNFIKSLKSGVQKFENNSLKKLILSRNHLTNTDDFNSMKLSKLTILTLFGNSIESPKDDSLTEE